MFNSQRSNMRGKERSTSIMLVPIFIERPAEVR